MRRTQIYVEEEQDRRLGERASQLGVTKSELIRTAVDEYLAEEEAGSRLVAFRDAVTRTAASVRSLPDGAQYVDGLRDADAKRLQVLEHT